MRHSTDKAIAKLIIDDPKTKHLTPDQLQILIAETIRLVRASEADFRNRRNPPKPLKSPKPPRIRKPRRPPLHGRPFSAADIIVAAHMHRCGMQWREIDALFGRHCMNKAVKRCGFFTGRIDGRKTKPGRIGGFKA